MITTATSGPNLTAGIRVQRGGRSSSAVAADGLQEEGFGVAVNTYRYICGRKGAPSCMVGSLSGGEAAVPNLALHDPAL